MVFVVKLWLEMVINLPKKHGYYTFTIGLLKPWLIFLRTKLVIMQKQVLRFFSIKGRNEI